MNVKKEINEVLASTSTNVEELASLAIKGAAVVGGAAAAYELFRHRRMLSIVGVAAAAAVFATKWLDGRCSRRSQSVRLASDAGSPSFPGENVSHATQSPNDPIDEALMESFPASDPPASYHRA